MWLQGVVRVRAGLAAIYDIAIDRHTVRRPSPTFRYRPSTLCFKKKLGLHPFSFFFAITVFMFEPIFVILAVIYASGNLQQNIGL